MSILVITVDHPDKEVEDELIAKYQKKIFEFDDKKADLHRDSGFDLFVPEKQVLDENDHMLSLNHGVRAACYSYPELKPLPYYLYPRSSISKTPFRMANSVGIIDSGYRGHLLAKLDCIQEKEEEIRKLRTQLKEIEKKRKQEAEQVPTKEEKNKPPSSSFLGNAGAYALVALASGVLTALIQKFITKV